LKAKPRVQFIDKGLTRYKACWDFQEELFQATVQRKIANRKLEDPSERIATENYLVFTEHHPVYTLGKSGKEENLLKSQSELNTAGIEFYKNNRGGDITFHGPGQIVAYPILDLDHFFTDIHKYLRFLEDAVIDVLTHYGIEAGRIDGLTGVWLDVDDADKSRKICAMGVKCSRWVTMHGLAFNINTDLDYFKNIIPCGIDDKAVTSLQHELGREVDVEEAKSLLKTALAKRFEFVY